MAADCWGLPLAVIAVAGILSSMEKEMYIWQDVGANLASYIFDGRDNSVMQILGLSFKHLPQHLKPCFLYFRAFTDRTETPVANLKRLWVAEGFIHKEQGKRAEDVAEEYLMELIDKNLVMVAKRRSDGGVKTCVLHDLLRDLCFKICEDENLLKEADHRNIYSVYENDLCHRSFHDTRDHKSWGYCQQIRSVHLVVVYRPAPLYVGRMRLLRVLHFDVIISNYLTGFEHLVNLRYLVIKDLPASIGSLVNLEYLRVETREVVYIPPAILRMMKLRHLKVFLARYGRNCNSFRPNNLEFLSCISIRKAEDEEMLKCSPNLRKLKSMYKRGRTSSNFDLSFLPHLQSLRLLVFGPGVTEFSFPSNIKKLSLYGKQNMPWEKMSIIGRLKNLEVFKLGMTGYEGDRWETGEDEFQKLRFLKLDRLVGLVEWHVELSGHFPALRRLVLSDCKNLQEIPCEIGEIEALQMIEIKGQCAESLVESAKQIKQQKKDINEALGLLINGRLVPSSLQYTCPSSESESELEPPLQGFFTKEP